MAILEIPIDPEAGHSVTTIELQGVEYHLVLDWNTRDESWYLSVQNSDGEELLSSSRLCLNSFPGGTSVGTILPPGVFMTVDTSYTGVQEPTLDSLGTTIKLLYLERT